MPLRDDEIIDEVVCGIRGCNSSGQGLNSSNNTELRSLKGSDNNNNEDLGIQIYPNPINGLLTIHSNTKVVNGSFIIYNLLQQPVLFGKLDGSGTNKIETASLADGAHVLVVKQEENIIFTDKIIKTNQ